MSIEKQQQERSWVDVLEAIQKTHTTTIKSICNDLKSSRQWVLKYVVPGIDKIYLSNGYNGTPAWRYIANLSIGRSVGDCESNYYCTAQYLEKVKSSLVKMQRQTIRCSFYAFFTEAQIKMMLPLLKALQVEKKKFTEENLKEESKIKRQINKIIYNGKEREKVYKIFEDFLLQNVSQQDLNYAKSSYYTGSHNRSAYTWFDCNCDWKIKELAAIHDLRGYGGVDEITYRNLFEFGNIKLTFNFSSKNGSSEKIFYFYNKEDEKYLLKDKNYPYNNFDDDFWEPFPYDFFLKYKKI